ncbi:MAG TPA: M23 family metallopeptidase [Gaiellaceae bacterium]|nr:M23 family metallopeptidase [Gaiellaceae bacterium]
MLRLAPVMLAAALLLALPHAAQARPDGPLGAYLEHQEGVLVLGIPAVGTLTDGFGARWGRLHSGLDIGILRSLDVVAAAPGTVTATGYLAGYEGYGNVVIVDLGGGHENLYAHLSRVAVKLGQRVEAGQRLGEAGCTGSCTGTHLHFELRVDGEPVDPLPLMRL